MSPPRRRSTYKAPRNRRELTIAVLSSVAIIVVTALLIWFLRPNKDSGTEPITTTPVATTAVTTTTPAPTDSTATPGDTTPAETTPSDSTPTTSP